MKVTVNQELVDKLNSLMADLAKIEVDITTSYWLMIDGEEFFHGAKTPVGNFSLEDGKLIFNYPDGDVFYSDIYENCLVYIRFSASTLKTLTSEKFGDLAK